MARRGRYYPEYVSVGERRKKAAKKIEQLRKKDPSIRPVVIEGRALARTWWGKSWNENLERYADYSNRIGRGRSYVRHGAVLDLQLDANRITATVQGSRARPYNVVIKVGKLSDHNWAEIRNASEGCFDSLGELLAGKFPQAMKDLFFRKGAGLFPTPDEIHFDCSCPDWASMCKHVAAVLYGVGARLDDEPALFFVLRDVNLDDLISHTVADAADTLLDKAKNKSDRILADVDLGDVFGIQMNDMTAPFATPPPAATEKAVSGKKKSARQVARTPRKQTQNTAAPARGNPGGSMLDALLQALGATRKGKTVESLQTTLGWTKTQIRNAISRANAKGLVEAVRPGAYRQKR